MEFESNLMNELDKHNGILRSVIAPRTRYKCCRCQNRMACVIKVDNDLICITCRHDDIGVEALYEPLHNE
jgi:hypothetical protein